MKEIINFLQEVDRNNNREWFAENKEWYKKVQAKWNKFALELIQEVGKFDDKISICLCGNDICGGGDASWVCVGNDGFCESFFAGAIAIYLISMPENASKEVEIYWIFNKSFPCSF